MSDRSKRPNGYAWLNLAIGLAVRFRSHTLQPMKRVLIMVPGDPEILLLASAIPEAIVTAHATAKVDWLVSRSLRMLVASNPQLHQIITIPHSVSATPVAELLRLARSGDYDTCLLPAACGRLAYVAWRAGIPQRIGIDRRGSGLSCTLSVRAATGSGAADAVRDLIIAAGGDPDSRMAVYPSDANRSTAMQLLLQHGGAGDRPLILLDPSFDSASAPWPVERFVRLAHRLARDGQPEIVIVNAVAHSSIGDTMAGLLTQPAVNLSQKLNWAELAALCEIAAMYVGHMGVGALLAIAAGAPTVALEAGETGRALWPSSSAGRAILLDVGKESEMDGEQQLAYVTDQFASWQSPSSPQA